MKTTTPKRIGQLLAALLLALLGLPGRAATDANLSAPILYSIEHDSITGKDTTIFYHSGDTVCVARNTKVYVTDLQADTIYLNFHKVIQSQGDNTNFIVDAPGTVLAFGISKGRNSDHTLVYFTIRSKGIWELVSNTKYLTKWQGDPFIIATRSFTPDQHLLTDKSYSAAGSPFNLGYSDTCTIRGGVLYANSWPGPPVHLIVEPGRDSEESWLMKATPDYKSLQYLGIDGSNKLMTINADRQLLTITVDEDGNATISQKGDPENIVWYDPKNDRFVVASRNAQGLEPVQLYHLTYAHSESETFPGVEDNFENLGTSVVFTGEATIMGTWGTDLWVEDAKHNPAYVHLDEPLPTTANRGWKMTGFLAIPSKYRDSQLTQLALYDLPSKTRAHSWMLSYGGFIEIPTISATQMDANLGRIVKIEGLSINFNNDSTATATQAAGSFTLVNKLHALQGPKKVGDRPDAKTADWQVDMPWPKAGTSYNEVAAAGPLMPDYGNISVTNMWPYVIGASDIITGVKNPTAEPGEVYADGNSIVAPAGSQAYTPAGIRQASLQDLDAGVYIVRTPEGKTAKVVVK